MTVTDSDTVDPFNKIRLNIIGDGKAQGYFRISDIGSLTLIRNLQDDSDLEYTVRIRATDGMGKRNERDAVVRVIVSRNLNAPIFNPTIYEKTVQDNQPLGDTILTVTATDADKYAPHNTIFFQIMSNNDGSHSYFQIDDSGKLFLKRSLALDNSLRTEYKITVKAFDRGRPQRKESNNNAQITIQVLRNQNSPIFFNSSYYALIKENEISTDRLITTVAASDQDTIPDFNTLKYNIIGDDKSINFFKIRNDNGEIRIARNFINDPAELYKIRVLASDNGNPPRTASVFVSVEIDRNLNSPKWRNGQNINFRVLETIATGTNIGRVRATDSDRHPPNNQITYHLIGDSKALDYFQVDDRRGELSIRKDLTSDSSGTLLYNLILIARDVGKIPRSSSNITINVQVIRNLNPPKFTSGDFTLSQPIRPQTSTGSKIYTASVSDGDGGSQFGSIKFSLIGTSVAKNFFSINEITGEVRVKSPLNVDPSTQYTLIILAEDNGDPPKSAQMILTVPINRNQNKPRFLSNNKNVIILENQKLGEPIESVSAFDSDSFKPFNTVSYRLKSDGVNADYFNVDPFTGNITVKTSLNSNSNEIYRVNTLEI